MCHERIIKTKNITTVIIISNIYQLLTLKTFQEIFQIFLAYSLLVRLIQLKKRTLKCHLSTFEISTYIIDLKMIYLCYITYCYHL